MSIVIQTMAEARGARAISGADVSEMKERGAGCGETKSQKSIALFGKRGFMRNGTTGEGWC